MTTALEAARVRQPNLDIHRGGEATDERRGTRHLITEAGLQPRSSAEGSDECSAHSGAIGASARTQAARPETGRVLPAPVTVTSSLPSADTAITAVQVVDDAGRRWTQLPDAWRARADLCGSVASYDFGGDTFVVRCRCLSDWASGSDGLCARHFAASLEVGE